MRRETRQIADWMTIFNREETYVLWGCTEFAESLIASIGDIMKIAYIVDRNEQICGKSFAGYEVKSVKQLLSDRKYKIIITNHYPVTRNAICEELKRMGYQENTDFSYYQYFISYWGWEYKQKLAVPYMEMPITTLCTLRCKKCAAYMPYAINRKNRLLESLKADLERYFRNIDWTARFRLVGGEPLLYPRLQELVEYIGENYRQKIGEFTLVTNGTVIPTEELQKTLVRYHVNFFISDYSSCGHPLTSDTQYDKLREVLDNSKIKYVFSRTLRWIDLGNPLQPSGLTKEQLIERYEDCKLDRRSLIDGMIFPCGQLGNAYIAGIASVKECAKDEMIRLDVFNRLSRQEMLRELLRFDVENAFENGYIAFCDRCKGEGALNQEYVAVGEQL